MTKPAGDDDPFLRSFTPRPRVPMGIAAPLRISPETVANAAGNFARGQSDLADAWMRLDGALQGAPGMAGDDRPAHTFDAKYSPAAEIVWKGFRKAIRVLGGTSLGLTRTADTHIVADYRSRADSPSADPPMYSARRIYPDMSMATPPTAIGPPDTSLLGGYERHFYSLIAGYWPHAHTGELRSAATAWRAAADEVDKVTSWLDWTMRGLIDDNDGAGIDAIGGYWATIYKPGDPGTVLVGLSEVCGALGSSCDGYATLVDQVRGNMADRADETLTVTVLTAGVAGFAARGLATVLGALADSAVAATTAILSRYLADGLVATVETAVDAARVVQAVEADFDQTAAKALDREMTSSEGSLPLEGRRDYVVDDPADPGTTITDVDHIDKGVLWEEKSATDALDVGTWVSKHIDKKFASYMEARQYIPGYEQAPIGFDFTNPGATPALRAAVEAEINRLRAANPGVTILLRWS